VGLYLIPLGMIANPSLIELSAHPIAAVASMLKVGIALAMVSYALIAARQWGARVGFLAAGLIILFVPFAPFAVSAAG
jgi:hypothetical protein